MSIADGADTQATMRRQEKRLQVNEVKMLRWMGAVTKKYKTRNEHVRGSVKVTPVTRKTTEKSGTDMLREGTKGTCYEEC